MVVERYAARNAGQAVALDRGELTPEAYQAWMGALRERTSVRNTP
jgi:hypothetical protein